MLKPRFMHVIGLLFFLAGRSVAVPLTKIALECQARCEVLVKLCSLDRNLDGATLLPMDLQERICATGPALPISRGDFAASELQKIRCLRFDDEQGAREALEILHQSEEVEWAEPRLLRHTCGQIMRKDLSRERRLDGPPNDPYYPLQWGLTRVQAEAGWDLSQGNSDLIIAICDLGTDFTHPDLAPQQWVNSAELAGRAGIDDDDNGFVDDFYGYDWVDLDGDPAPENGDSHGTHVGGIAGAARNNNIGISGLAGNCRLMGVRCGTGVTVPYGFEGIYYAVQSGAKIVNCSWSGTSFSNYENEIIAYARDLGVIVVAAAGNESETVNHYPASYDGVVSVAATGISDFAADFTNYGPWVDISAPGVNILSTLPQNHYGYASGTSMSCPLVVGALALVWSRRPELSGAQIASRLIASADPIDIRNGALAEQLGLGRLNVYRALADTLPGIRLEHIAWQEIAGDMDGRVEPGERALLTVSVWNDLAPAQNVTGHLEFATSHARLLRDASPYGDLPTGGPYANASPFFEFEMLTDAQNGLVIPIALEWTDATGRILARTQYHLQADSQTTTLANGALALGVGENGSFGSYDYIQNYQVGVGLQELDAPLNYLWHGSLLVGAHSVVSDNCFGNTEGTRFDFLALPESTAWVGRSARADREARASFRDSGSQSPLFVDVHANVLAFYGLQANHLFILEFTAVNRSVNAYEDAYLGLFLDWDIPNWGMNIGGFDITGDLAYAHSMLPGSSWGGIASITPPFSAYRLLRNESDLYSGGWSDGRKWEILTGGIVPVQDDAATDISEIVAVGPFRLEPDMPTTIAMAVLVGEDSAALRPLAAQARSLYSPPTSPPFIEEQQSLSVPRIALFPNPVAPGMPLQVLLPAGESGRVRFYNILGQQIGPSIPIVAGTGNRPSVLSWFPTASGSLFYQIETSTTLHSGQLVILK